MRKRSYEKNCCSREMYLKGSVIAGLVGVVLGTEILFPGDKELGHVTSPLPFTYISERDLPKAFSWDNVNGISYLTKNLNQHIPQYCGSCWAHSSMSALSDRIKIARNASGLDINLSIQYILNCASEAGSCHGGSAIRAYQVLHDMGGIPYDDCMPYIACSSDSTNGFCPYVDTTCDQVCRTCTNQSCAPIKQYPNATIAEYGSYNDADVWKIMAEIYARGPVKASVNAGPLQDYAGGILFDNDITRNTTHNHGVSLVGWGFDEESQKQYWIVRNSWGSYWGELGFFKIELGKNLLGIEGHIAWAKPGYITEKNFPCAVDGSNCAGDANRHSGMASVY